MKTKLLFLTIAVLCFSAAPAMATTFGFFNISHNDPDDAADGEAQLTVDVTDAGNDQVMFTFNNNIPDIDGDVPMFISDIYFYDGGLINPVISGPSGVDFIEGASPGHLPEYKPEDLSTFFTTSTPNPGTNEDGVDPGEWVSVLFDISNPSEYSYAQLLSDIGNSVVVLGIKVQGFVSGGSETFITPVPGAVLLGILGLAVVGLKLRKHA